jgi:hypothetical protein
MQAHAEASLYHALKYFILIFTGLADSDNDPDHPSHDEDTAPALIHDVPDPITSAVWPVSRPVCANPFSFAFFLHKSSGGDVCSSIKSCKSMLHRQPASRVCSDLAIQNYHISHISHISHIPQIAHIYHIFHMYYIYYICRKDWLALVDGYCYVGRQRSRTWIKLDIGVACSGSTRSANASVVLRLGTPTNLNRGEGRVGSGWSRAEGPDGSLDSDDPRARTTDPLGQVSGGPLKTRSPESRSEPLSWAVARVILSRK